MTPAARLLAYMLGVACAAVATGCGHTDSDRGARVPLPTAWPRIDVSASDSMARVPGLPLDVLINPAATYEILETYPPGLTVTYPRGAARIYYTFIETDNDADRQKVVDMRRQRISLNLNGTPAVTRHGHSPDNADGEAVLVAATSTSQTPIQLLADMGQFVVTATAFVDTPRARYDSIYPLYKVLEHDLSRTLPALTFDTHED